MKQAVWAAWGALVVLWSAESSACSCAYLFELVGTQRRFDHDTGEHVGRPVPDPSKPILVLLSDELMEPELYLGEESLTFSLNRLTDDSLCGGDIVALAPGRTIAPGESLELVSPSLKQRAQEYESSNGRASGIEHTFSFQTGGARAPIDSELRVSVSWERSWPTKLSGSCTANELIGLDGHGIARVLIQSQSEVVFFAQAEVTLPDGEVYRQLAASQHRTRWEDERAQLLGGSQLSDTLPLTHPGDIPECVVVNIFDHELALVHRGQYCPDEEQFSLGATSATAVIPARLAQLPDFPVFPEDEPKEEKGCTVAGEAGLPSTSFWGALTLLGTWVARRWRGLMGDRARLRAR